MGRGTRDGFSYGVRPAARSRGWPSRARRNGPMRRARPPCCVRDSNTIGSQASWESDRMPVALGSEYAIVPGNEIQRARSSNDGEGQVVMPQARYRKKKFKASERSKPRTTQRIQNSEFHSCSSLFVGYAEARTRFGAREGDCVLAQASLDHLVECHRPVERNDNRTLVEPGIRC